MTVIIIMRKKIYLNARVTIWEGVSFQLFFSTTRMKEEKEEEDVSKRRVRRRLRFPLSIYQYLLIYLFISLTHTISHHRIGYRPSFLRSLACFDRSNKERTSETYRSRSLSLSLAVWCGTRQGERVIYYLSLFIITLSPLYLFFFNK